MTSIGAAFVPNFVKICQFVHNLKDTHTQDSIVTTLNIFFFLKERNGSDN
jgi:hypothetical protein